MATAQTWTPPTGHTGHIQCRATQGEIYPGKSVLSGESWPRARTIRVGRFHAIFPRVYHQRSCNQLSILLFLLLAAARCGP